MRTTRDRIRHALSFEIIGLLIVTPLGAWTFGMPLHDIGMVSLVSATLATAWNYIYNLLFDHAMLRLIGRVQKTLPVRIVHAVLFEFGLLLVLMPFIAIYLGVSLVQAFYMDAAFALFYMIYAFVFNWVYDWIWPVPTAEGASVRHQSRRGLGVHETPRIKNSEFE
ncbi:PACE efflux transporter [Fodinicurvata sediminis]|uniref:PACE efflux transporter n=1 Tax=Fodinicurvata sediminis TaxID=1121832 RepID=UPI0003B382E6|nr:PACE efflux transporter [Fodinicurvata sediminis]